MSPFRILFMLIAVLAVFPVDAAELDAYKTNFALQEIRDPQMHNESAATIALPNGWKFKDRNIVQWNSATYTDPARVTFTLNGPKDEATFMFLSSQSFHYDYGLERVASMLRQRQAGIQRILNDVMDRPGNPPPTLNQSPFEYKENIVDSGGIVRKPMQPDAFIRQLVGQDNTINRVQFTKSGKPEQAVAALKKAVPEMNQQARNMFGADAAGGRFKGITAETALVEFTCYKNGRQYEQQVAVIITYLRLASPFNVFTGASDDAVYWTISPLTSAYALKGKLKDHQLEIATIMANSQVNPVWKAKVEHLVAETVRKITLQKIKSQAEMQKIMQDTAAHIAKTQREVFENRHDVMAKVMQGWSDVITDTDRVRGDDGKIYAVPAGAFPERRVPWAW